MTVFAQTVQILGDRECVLYNHG